ncbi:MAG: hypothetical protein IJT07_03575 [Oscillospiraceae bacterium]|nr:hypothetical protein [Oscillospiraceae bacterium]
MEKRVSYALSRKSALTWLIAILPAVSAGCRIAFYCGWKGAGSMTVWQQLILPLAAALTALLVLLFGSEERLYRMSIPAAFWAVVNALRMQNLPIYAVPALRVLPWLLMLAVWIVLHRTFAGTLRIRWLSAVILGGMLVSECVSAVLLRGEGAWISLSAIASALTTLTLFATVICMKRHGDGKYHMTWGDRNDGRRVRTLAPITYVGAYIMPDRTGASNNIKVSFDLDAVEKYIHEKRKQGMTSFGITHVLLTAYVRCCAQYPALNRFVAGQHIYSRDEDIQFSMIVKKDMTVEAPDTAIKLHLNPADTAADVYRKFDAAVEDVKNSPVDNSLDEVAALLTKIPGVLLKLVVWILKTMDYFGLLPKFLLEVSPFHGSLFFTSMGSLGIPPVTHHLYDFGNLPAFIAFGSKRRAYELNAEGEVVTKKYVDCTFNLDERAVDGFYYATVLRTYQRLIRHPEQLDNPPETVLHDVP